MPAPPPTEPTSSGGIHVGNVAGGVSFNALGPIVGGNLTITTTTQITPDVVTQKSLVTTSPYRGLDRFEDRDKDLFFGRDQLIKSLLAQLSASNVLLVLGASGSGKSSVVRAGLLPQLAKLIGARFRYFTLVPDVNPFESLRSAIQAAGFTQAQTRELGDAKPETPSKLIHTLQREGDQWLFFVDQFEEMFTVGDEKLRASFVAALTQIAQDPNGSTKLVLAMRADFLDRFSPFPQFAKIIEKNIDFVADMHTDELRQAIEQPAARHGVVFEQGLVEEIIKDVQGQAGSLPLLQYTLDLLWQEEVREDGLADRHLNTRAYRELGGVRGALQKRADEIYASFGVDPDAKTPTPQQEIVRQIFLRLVDLAGEGSNDAAWRPVRRRASMTIFTTAQEQKILQALINQKLLVSNREGDDATVEVAHEALFTSWGRLKNWIEAGKQVIFARNRLADDARRWQRRQQEGDTGADEELLGGSRLAQALDMRARGDFLTVVGGLGETETQFLDASLALRERRAQEEQLRQQRELEAAQRLAQTQKLAAARLRIGLGVALALLLVAIWSGIMAFRKANEAKESTQKAKETLSNSDFLQAADLLEQGKTNEALAYLARSIETFPENGAAADRIFSLLTQRHFLLQASRSASLEAIVTSIRFLPDGRCLVAAVNGQMAGVFEAHTGKSIAEMLNHADAVQVAELSPDGTLLATSCDRVVKTSITDSSWPRPESRSEKQGDRAMSGQARVWNVATSKPLGHPLEHGGSVIDVRFSPDGQRVVTASEDATARVWNARDGIPLTPPLQHDSAVVTARFSPDGTHILTASAGPKPVNPLRIWQSKTGELVCAVGDTYGAASADYSPDASYVVLRSAADREHQYIKLVDANTGELIKLVKAEPPNAEIGQVPPGDATIQSVSFAADSQGILSTIVSDRVLVGEISQTPEKTQETTGYDRNRPFVYQEKPLPETLAAKLDTMISPTCIALVPKKQGIVAGFGDYTLRPLSPNGFHLFASPENKASSSQRSSLAPAVKLSSLPYHIEPDPSGVTMLVVGQEPDPGNGFVYSSLQFWFLTSPQGGEVVAGSKKANQDAAFEQIDSSALDTSQDRKRYLKRWGNGSISIVTADKSAVNEASISLAAEPNEILETIEDARFSPDGRFVVTSAINESTGSAFRIWSANTGRALTARLPYVGKLMCMAFPSEDRLFTAAFAVTENRLNGRIWDVRSGRPLSDDIDLTGTQMNSRETQQRRDGRLSFRGFDDDYSKTIDIGFPAKTKMPSWMPRLAEAVCGFRLNHESGVLEPLPDQFERLETLRAQLLNNTTDDPATRFGRWFLADTRTRPISPFSIVTTAEYIEQYLKSGKEETLYSAEILTNADTERLRRIATKRAQAPKQ